MQRTGLLVLLMVCVFVAAVPVGAQDGANLLRDGDFEGQYTGRGRPDFNIAADWNVWYAESPRTEDWMNLPPVAFPHNGPGPDPKSGARAQNLHKGWATFTAAIYQQVSVAPGTNLRGSAFAQLHTCSPAPNADSCASAVESGAYVKVGIDPNGGTNPYDSDIVWSAEIRPHGSWQEAVVEATATADTVTFFIFTTQTSPSEINRVFFDDARLVATGSGGSNPPAAGGSGDAAQPAAPPPPQYASRVSPQGERPDGSIVHVVQPGDTIDAIAVAYGLTRADILELNQISDPRIIQIGQELLIKEGDGSRSRTRSSDDDADDEADSSAAEDDEAAAENDEGDDGDDARPQRREYVDPKDAAPAPVVSVASGDVLPARDPAALSATLCLLMFDDANQNRIQEDGEPALAGGVISVRAQGNEVSEYTTDGASEPHCIEDLTPGSYVAVATAPDGYGLTTPNQFRITANPGATINVAFGAAEGVTPVMVPPPDNVVLVEETPESPEAEPEPDPIRDNLGLAVFGLAGVVLVAGTGASLFMRRR